MQKQNFHKKFKMLKTLAILSFACSILSIFVLYLWLASLGVFTIKVDSLAKEATSHQPENSLVFDRNGVRIGEIFDKYQVYVPFEKIPKDLINAIVAIEDRTFFSHSGIDAKAMLRAASDLIVERAYTQGASTITQQVVRNLFLTKEKSIERKAKEIVIAMRLERALTKKQILELYVNQIFLGYGAYGVGAAAIRFFGRSLDKLEIHELALIAGLYQSPSLYNPHRFPNRALKRQRQVLNAMYAAKFISKKQTLELAKRPLIYKPYTFLNAQLAPHFIDYVKEQATSLTDQKIENTGLRIYTTLDSRLQAKANETFLSSSKIFSEAEAAIIPNHRKQASNEKATVEASLLSTDPRTGEILAMVGGRDYERSKYNRAVQALRSPGSVFKPVVFSLALLHGRRWSDVLFVSPIAFDGYRPKNHFANYLTETTMLNALAQSLNTPTLEIGMRYGTRAIIEHAKKLGIRSPLKEEVGLMLGGTELSMFDLSRLYGTFANYGQQSELISISKITDHSNRVLYQAPSLTERHKDVIPPSISYLMTEGLRAVVQHGTGKRLSHLSNFIVGKTGTSNDSVDNWFCGYSPNLVTVVWVGNDKQLALGGNTTGGSIALPIWELFMTHALMLRPNETFVAPEGISHSVVHPRYGYRTEDGINMFFQSDRMPVESSSTFQAINEHGSFRTLYGH